MTAIVKMPRLEIRAGCIRVNDGEWRDVAPADKQLVMAFHDWLASQSQPTEPTEPPGTSDPFERVWNEDR